MDTGTCCFARTAPTSTTNGNGKQSRSTARITPPGCTAARAEALRAEIEDLSLDALRLSSIQDALLALNRECEESFVAFRSAKGAQDQFLRVHYKPLDVEPCLEEIAALSNRLPTDGDAAELAALEREVKVLRKRLELKCHTLRVLFINLAYPAINSRDLVDDLVSRIGHKMLRAEAATSKAIIHRLAERLKPEKLTDGDVNILHESALSAVGVMTQIAKHLTAVKNLVRLDRRRRDQTATLVIGYIVVMFTAAVSVMALLAYAWQTDHDALNGLTLPFIGIPLAVVLWSAIGSFAAMLYRFNRHPIHEFTDAFKWLITRPVQGIVVGSAFYLVFLSGLVLVGAAPPVGAATAPTASASRSSAPAAASTGGAVATAPTSGEAAAAPASNEPTTSSASSTMAAAPTRTSAAVVPMGGAPRDLLILVLAFLVGFSDRFADAVFNALVERYAPGSRKAEAASPAG